MAGGPEWEDPEKALIDNALSRGLTQVEAYGEYDATYPGKRSLSAFSRQMCAQKALAKAASPTPSSIARHLSGEAVPGVYDGPAFPDWEIPEDVDWREWFGQFTKAQDLYKRIDPSQEILTVDLSHVERPINVAFAADIHLGGGYTDYEAVSSTIEYVLETDDLYLVLAGDVMEGFIPGEKSAETVEQMVAGNKGQLGAMRSMVRELCHAGKILCLTWGDHDAKWWEKLVGLNLVKREFHDRVPYFNGRGLVRLLVGDQEYFLQVNHQGKGSSQYNPNHPQKKMDLKFFPADVTVSGHLHKPAFQMEHRLSQLRQVGINLGGKTWYVQVGTFKTGPDAYTIRWWTRGIMGVPTATFLPDAHDVDMHESPLKAEAFRKGLRTLAA